MSHFYWKEYVFFNIIKYVFIKELGLPVEDLKSHGDVEGLQKINRVP